MYLLSSKRTVQPQTEPAMLLLLKFHRLPAFCKCNVSGSCSGIIKLFVETAPYSVNRTFVGKLPTYSCAKFANSISIPFLLYHDSMCLTAFAIDIDSELQPEIVSIEVISL